MTRIAARLENGHAEKAEGEKKGDEAEGAAFAFGEMEEHGGQ